MMSHNLTYIATAGFLLLSPSVLAQSVLTQGVSVLEPESQSTSRLAQADTRLSQVDSQVLDWQHQVAPNWRLRQHDLGLQFSPGQYHGNRGLASEEQGIQL